MDIQNIKKKIGGKWYVYSHDGKKKLGGPYDTEGEADKRLEQIEYFKAHTSFHNLRITCNLKPALVRNEQMQGRDYTVVPMVMLVPGVHAGTAGPYLYTEHELSKHPGLWNMKPVTVYHPSTPSACSPEVLNARGIGIIMNTKWEEDQLKAEAWLDNERVEKVDSRVKEAIRKQTVMELSTGLFADSDETPGEENGEEYLGTLCNYAPDHLALLPDQVGACSVEDGAGFIRNVNGAEIKLSPTWTKYFNELSHETLRGMLRQLVSKTDKFAYVDDVFDDYFIYSTEKGDMFKQGYEVKSTAAALKGVPETVVRVISYEPKSTMKNSSEKDSEMEKKKIIDALISNKATKWEEKDREYLNSLDDKVLEKLVPVEIKPEEVKPTIDPATVQNVQTSPSAPAKPQTVEECLASMPTAIRNSVQRSLNRDAREKVRLIAIIKASPRNRFTDAYLNARDVDELEPMAALATPEPAPGDDLDLGDDYGAQADVVQNAGEVTQKSLPLPVYNFTAKKTA